KPRLQAEHLIAHALGLKRMDLYLQAQRPLEEGALAKIRPLVRRRAKREPLQYIIGETDFWKSTLHCRPGALIPRPETEELIEHTVAIWNQISDTDPRRIIDLGTGSGAISIALASEFPSAAVCAVDSSGEALELAEENARKNDLIRRIQFVKSHWFTEVEGPFDLIVSNPPYLTQAEVNSAAPEVRDFEPTQALRGRDSDGAGDLRQILLESKNMIDASHPHLIALETGIAQHLALAKFAQEQAWPFTHSQKDLQSRHRFFFASHSPIGIRSTHADTVQSDPRV
ncbi:MAG: peptide chain release factor N(5)-glutamine methyltransferase, partial [Verrucomicrobiota bacterium]